MSRTAEDKVKALQGELEAACGKLAQAEENSQKQLVAGEENFRKQIETMQAEAQTPYQKLMDEHQELKKAVASQVRSHGKP